MDAEFVAKRRRAMSATTREGTQQDSGTTGNVGQLQKGVKEARTNVERSAARTWTLVRKHPYVGAGVAGGLGFALAVVGGAEIAVALGAGYAAYRYLKGRPAHAQGG